MKAMLQKYAWLYKRRLRDWAWGMQDKANAAVYTGAGDPSVDRTQRDGSAK